MPRPFIYFFGERKYMITFLNKYELTQRCPSRNLEISKMNLSMEK